MWRVSRVTPDGVDFLDGDPGVSAGAITFEITCGRDPFPNGTSRPNNVAISWPTLAARYTRMLREGVEADELFWQELKRMAGRLLVPKSSQSRLYGTEAMVDDNE